MHTTSANYITIGFLAFAALGIGLTWAGQEYTFVDITDALCIALVLGAVVRGLAQRFK